MKILIDNGHGIETPDKRSPDGRLLEYLENRIIARGIVDASLLVPEETDISLPERCRRVNEWCRQLGRQNVILVSLHCNAAGHGDRWLFVRGWCASAPTTPTATPTRKPPSTSYAIPDAPPSSPKTSSWTTTRTVTSSSAKKANNPLLTSMSMASAPIWVTVDNYSE